jgi:hypothetical protein
MQRNTFHDIRPKRLATTRVSRVAPSHFPAEGESPTDVPAEQGSQKENDFFSYVKGDTDRKKTRRAKRSTESASRLSNSKQKSKPIFNTPEFRRVSGERKEQGKNGIWWVASFFLVVFLVLLMNMFRGATVTIVPRTETAFIDGIFTGVLIADTEEHLSEEVLPYQTMVVSVDKEKEIPAAGEENVSYRASGRIIIYNTYTTNEQRLVKRTRFEDGEGRIYRINESIVVPGMAEIDGKMIPGSIEVTVYADEPGEEYNIGLSDFTIPGFKESGLSKQYEKFYARSKTEMTGGFVGTQKVALPEDIAIARSEMEVVLRESLKEEWNASLPEGYRVIEGSEIVTFNHADSGEAGNNMVRISSSGTMQAMIASRDDIAMLVARNAVSRYSGEAVGLLHAEGLSVALEHTLGEEAESPVRIHVSGSADVLWKHDNQGMRSELIGASRKEFDTIMKQYPNVEHISVSMRPFWNTSFPDAADNIHIVQLIDGEKVEE